MAMPVIDERHRPLRQFVQQLADICLSAEFIALRRELELHYVRCGIKHPAWTAFQDALYAILAQEEFDAARRPLEQ